ncbi:MAG: hypothetical protein ACE5I3_02385 [Phycisphaerae bacterium]
MPSDKHILVVEDEPEVALVAVRSLPPGSCVRNVAHDDSFSRWTQSATEPNRTLASASITLDRTRFRVCAGETVVSLSKIEYRILATLLAARGHVLEATRSSASPSAGKTARPISESSPAALP